MNGGYTKAGLAEALGVFFLVFVGGSSICMDQFMTADLRESGLGALGIALVHGFALMVAVYAAAGISGGHINPAVTIGLWVIGKCEAARMLTYLVFQLIGGVIGGLCVYAMFPLYRDSLPYLGAPRFTSEGVGAIGPIKAIGIEALLTFVLVIVVIMVAVDSRRMAKQMFGICIGLTLAMLAMIGGFTGAALNPARHFGPAIVSTESTVLSQIPIYFAGPILGGIIAALVYKLLLEQKGEATEAA